MRSASRWRSTPNVPPERAKALRDAFDATLKDPEFIKAADGRADRGQCRSAASRCRTPWQQGPGDAAASRRARASRSSPNRSARTAMPHTRRPRERSQRSDCPRPDPRRAPGRCACASLARLGRQRGAHRAAGKSRRISPAATRPISRTSTATSAAWRSTCAARKAAPILYRMVEKTDVLVENFRPDVKTRLELRLRDAQGQEPAPHLRQHLGLRRRTVPIKDRPGVDQVVQGMSGLMSVTGEPGRGPMRVGIPISDIVTGLYARARHPDRAGRAADDRAKGSGCSRRCLNRRPSCSTCRRRAIWSTAWCPSRSATSIRAGRRPTPTRPRMAM